VDFSFGVTSKMLQYTCMNVILLPVSARTQRHPQRPQTRKRFSDTWSTSENRRLWPRKV